MGIFWGLLGLLGLGYLLYALWCEGELYQVRVSMIILFIALSISAYIVGPFFFLLAWLSLKIAIYLPDLKDADRVIFTLKRHEKRP